MTERELLERTERLLAELLERPIHTTAPREALDATWATGEHVFLVEAKTSAHSMAHIEQGVRRLQSAADRHPGVIPLLVVPTMGPAGVRLAKEAGISWIDAGGKADIAAPGLRILIKHGNNASPPRKSGTFSPRASNLVHVLLLKPKVEHTASELAHAARLDNGYVTRILDALVEEGYIVEQRRGRQRRIHVAEPNALLTAWDEHYKRPQPFAYALLATRDGFATEARVAEAFHAVDVPYALTALSAAAAYTRFGSFRRVTAYVPRDGLTMDSVGFEMTTEPRGRNVALVASPIHFEIGTRTIAGRTYASPILTYLDLKAEAERAEEARTEMKRVIEDLWNESY